MLEFRVSNEAGDGGAVSMPELIQQLQEAGYQPGGYTADGMQLTLHDDQGPYNVRTTDVLGQLGWNVLDIRPENADYSAVSPQWRAAIGALPNDDTRRAYVEGQLKRLGHQEAQVIGQGDEWYAYNPATSQWVGLTNEPGADMSDVAGIAAGAPRFLGSIAGGALGGLGAGALGLPSGPGALAVAAAGTAAGAGLGGGLGDAATRAALGAMDPELARVMRENLGDVAKDVALNAGVDAATGGAARALAPVARGVINSGPVSTAVRGLGYGAEKGGQAVSGAARFLRGGTARQAAAAEEALAGAGAGKQMLGALTGPQMRQDLAAGMFVPGGAEAQALGYGLQAPAMLARSGLNLGEGLAESRLLQELAPGAAKNLGAFISRMSRGSPRMPAPERAAEEIAARLGGQKGTIDSTLKIGDLGRSAGETAAASLSRKPGSVYTQVLERSQASGMPFAEARQAAEEAAQRQLGTIADRSVTWGRRGESVGRAVDAAENLGEGITTGLRTVTRKGLEAADYGGKAAQYGGRAAKLAGRVAQPAENRAYMRYGAEEALGPDYGRLDPWSRRKERARMGQVLAQKKY